MLPCYVRLRVNRPQVVSLGAVISFDCIHKCCNRDGQTDGFHDERCYLHNISPPFFDVNRGSDAQKNFPPSVSFGNPPQNKQGSTACFPSCQIQDLANFSVRLLFYQKTRILSIQFRHIFGENRAFFLIMHLHLNNASTRPATAVRAHNLRPLGSFLIAASSAAAVLPAGIRCLGFRSLCTRCLPA